MPITTPINITEMIKNSFTGSMSLVPRIVRRSLSTKSLYFNNFEYRERSSRKIRILWPTWHDDPSFASCETLNAHRSSLFSGVRRIHQLCSNVLARPCTRVRFTESNPFRFITDPSWPIHDVDPATTLNYDRMRALSRVGFAVYDSRRPLNVQTRRCLRQMVYF